MLRTLIPKLDAKISFEQPSLVLVGGYQGAVDCFATGLVMTADNIQWVRCTERNFVAPKPGVEVIDWNAVDRTSNVPKGNTVVFIDGIQALAERINWEKCVNMLNDFAQEHNLLLVGLATDEQGSKLDPTSILPEGLVDLWRGKASYIITFAQRHFTEVKARIERKGEHTEVDLGSPNALQDLVTKEVNAVLSQG